jgi:DNA repair photolyase
MFEQWLQTHFPDCKDKVLNRIRAIRGGKLYDSQFGKRMSGEGIFAEQMDTLFEVACRKHGIGNNHANLSTAAFRRPTGNQLQLL